MNRDVAKLQGIARDLSELGLQLSNQADPPSLETCVSIGQAFVALSEAIGDITEALERGAAAVGRAAQEPARSTESASSAEPARSAEPASAAGPARPAEATPSAERPTV